jgi:hypothetical protein
MMRIIFNKPMKEFKDIKAKFRSRNDEEEGGGNIKGKQWEKDYKLMAWSHLTLFDEYLEMSKS